MDTDCFSSNCVIISLQFLLRIGTRLDLEVDNEFMVNWLIVACHKTIMVI